MIRLLIIIGIILLAYKGYSNYKSYPKYYTRPITIQTDEDDSEIFFKWNPCGRDKPVFSYPKWGM